MDTNANFIWLLQRGAWISIAFFIYLNLKFFPSKKEHPYGLRSPKNASRGLQSVLQAYIMKHFLFSVRPREKKSVPIEVFVAIFQFSI